MHNWGLAGDINLPLSALFIYLFILLFHFLLVFWLWQSINLHTTGILIGTKVSTYSVSKI